MSTSPFDAVSRAQLLIERARYDEARAVLAGALREHPQNVELMTLSGYIDYVTDRTDDALRIIESALQADPGHVAARDIYAHVLEEKKRFADAERVRIELLREFPEEANYYGAYASLMLRTMHLQKARQLAAEGLRFDPENSACLFVVALADLIDGRANESLSTLVREHPEQVRTAVALILSLQDRGDDKGALRVAQELLRSRPDSEEYVQIVRALKTRSHWSMLPLYPMQRWGWGGAVAVWFVAILGLRVAEEHVSPGMLGTLLAVWGLYVIYSWVWPWLLRKTL